MMLCVDKKMFHDSLRDPGFGPPPAAATDGGRDYARYPHDGPVPAHDQRRREVLLRVVRISGTLNQRLAL